MKEASLVCTHPENPLLADVGQLQTSQLLDYRL